jgi:hypothetical protein
MELVYWILLPFVVASGSALLGSILMKARMEVALGREREALVEARAAIAQFHKTMEEKIKTAASEARRKAMDEFLDDLHVEERHYLREKTSPSTRRKYLVLQERLYFRKIPLSHWVEHEKPVEEESNLEELARSISSFDGASQPLTEDSRVRKLLR